ncbi:MAG: hypothetical protein RBG13Loki_3586 [Promethearchaeota archaeon CR_4]|nr:MAG: hypothetical protein RBG13Loki_3586 [Candidatus Lokiarchaeota archaeon CR_4]
MSKHIKYDSKNITENEPLNGIEKPAAEIIMLQEHFIKETEILVERCFDPTKADIINYDAMQAICFLIVANQHIPLGEVELENCLTILGVHPVTLRNTVRILKKMYHIPKNMNLLRFIQCIGSILLQKNPHLEKDEK